MRSYHTICTIQIWVIQIIFSGIAFKTTIRRSHWQRVFTKDALYQIDPHGPLPVVLERERCERERVRCSKSFRERLFSLHWSVEYKAVAQYHWVSSTESVQRTPKLSNTHRLFIKIKTPDELSHDVHGNIVICSAYRTKVRTVWTLFGEHAADHHVTCIGQRLDVFDTARPLQCYFVCSE